MVAEQSGGCVQDALARLADLAQRADSALDEIATTVIDGDRDCRIRWPLDLGTLARSVRVTCDGSR